MTETTPSVPDDAPASVAGAAERKTLLTVRDLQVTAGNGNSQLTLVDGVSFDIAEGEIFGLVGESGSGKTMTALALIGLLPAVARASGIIRLGERELIGISEKEFRAVRGREIGMIFQEPVSALNPVFSLEAQIKAAVRAHSDMTDRQARDRAVELLGMVGIPDPVQRLSFYPHQLSGGMCQRVMIAMALAGGARLLIADEPTTALDVTIQDEIVRLIEDLASRAKISVLFISHDLGLVSRLCHRIAVAYAGEIVEIGDAKTLLHTPRHPYTQGLVRCVPDLESIGVLQRGIPGHPPLPGNWPPGCRFIARCPKSRAGCEQRQALQHVPHATGEVRCWRAHEHARSTNAADGARAWA
ncbi:MAG: ABC transporter ATP-binding protein [Xanthobacteraceae bacterium]